MASLKNLREGKQEGKQHQRSRLCDNMIFSFVPSVVIRKKTAYEETGTMSEWHVIQPVYHNIVTFLGIYHQLFSCDESDCHIIY